MVAIKIGQWAEQFAQQYLLAQGLHLLAANYHSRYGEIDLIMQEQQCICFIEVKARHFNSQVDGFTAVTPAKQHKIILTAEHFLQHYPIYQDYAARFDVLVLQYAKPLDFQQPWQRLLQQNRVNLQWLKHAYRL